MADHDYDPALDLSRSIRNNPKRPVAIRSPYETRGRAAKKARISSDSIALTIHSLATSTPKDSEVETAVTDFSSIPPQASQAPTPESILPSTPPPAAESIYLNAIEAGSSPLSSIPTPESESYTHGQSSGFMPSECPKSLVDAVPSMPETVFRQIEKQQEEDDEFFFSDHLNEWERSMLRELEPEEYDPVRKLNIAPRQKQDEEYVESTTNDHQNASIMEVAQSTAAVKGSTPAKKKAAVSSKTGKKYHTSAQEGKPEPHGQPAVWADKRQQLCETVPYFNSYEGGTYSSSGTVLGLLIDKEVSIRDKFEDEVIITSASGGRISDENGNRVLKADQLIRSAKSLISTMQQKSPVAVIAGQGNPISPSKLPHVYNVLDWFHITDVWPEKAGSDGYIVYKIRLEKIDLTEKSWWAVKETPVSSKATSAVSQKADAQICKTCRTSSKVKYNAGWACLERGCKSFFQFENEYDDSTLDYDDTYMNEHTAYSGTAPDTLSPPLLTEQDLIEMETFGFEKTFKRGIVCPKCRCCIRRIVWDHWSCENAHCDFTYALTQKSISPEDVIAKAMDDYDENKGPRTAPLSVEINKESVKGGVTCTQSNHGPWVINTYSIPDETGKIIGSVRHFKANALINEQADGPNDLFKEIQDGNLELRRNPARQAGCVGEVLTSHFAANFGAPYKFGVEQISKGFDKAPEFILKAIKRLSWAGDLAVTDQNEPFQPFNECLAIGYFEGSTIGYHDDGEKTLGPTVATLSVGAPAKMMFRPKAKGAVGGILAGNRKTKEAVLQFTLRHGDIVVMDGPLIQKLYEHSVIPYGFRFALTCRFIIKEKMGTKEERQAATLGGTLPPRSEQYTYDGDLNATAVIRSVSEVEKINNMIAARLMTGSLTQSQVSELNEKLAALLISNQAETEGMIMGDTEDIDMPDIQ